MNILSKYNTALSFEEQQALSLCTKQADFMNIKIYLVGGIVRDILLNREFNDIDILVEGDAITFAELLQKNYPNEIEILKKNIKFKTAKLKFSINNKIFEADCASTRSESYKYPSALPILEETAVNLDKDIKRRDFTINSLAMSLNSLTFCEVFDFTQNGINDLNNKLIRILHDKSFMDDPSRIVRGLKYRTKLNFILEDNTKLLQQSCLESKKFDDDCQKRIKKEVIETLNLCNSVCFNNFIYEKIYKLIISKVDIEKIPKGEFISEIIQNNKNHINTKNIWLIFLCILFNFAPHELVINNIEKLALNKNEKNIIINFFNLQEEISLLEKSQTNYDIYQLLKKYANETIIATLCIQKTNNISEKIHHYLMKLQNIKLTVSGKDIEKFGISKGIIYKNILDKVLIAKLNNNLNDTEEKEYLITLCKKTKDF